MQIIQGILFINKRKKEKTMKKKMLHELANIVLYNIFSIYCSNRAVAHAVRLTSRRHHGAPTASTPYIDSFLDIAINE